MNFLFRMAYFRCYVSFREGRQYIAIYNIIYIYFFFFGVGFGQKSDVACVKIGNVLESKSRVVMQPLDDSFLG